MYMNRTDQLLQCSLLCFIDSPMHTITPTPSTTSTSSSQALVTQTPAIVNEDNNSASISHISTVTPNPAVANITDETSKQ